jgi:hypothetical protein
VQVIDRLPAVFAAIHDDAISLTELLGGRDLLRDDQQVSEKKLLLRLAIVLRC